MLCVGRVALHSKCCSDQLSTNIYSIFRTQLVRAIGRQLDASDAGLPCLGKAITVAVCLCVEYECEVQNLL
jgi:hypothetical protein